MSCESELLTHECGPPNLRRKQLSDEIRKRRELRMHKCMNTTQTQHNDVNNVGSSHTTLQISRVNSLSKDRSPPALPSPRYRNFPVYLSLSWTPIHQARLRRLACQTKAAAGTYCLMQGFCYLGLWTCPRTRAAILQSKAVKRYDGLKKLARTSSF